MSNKSVEKKDANSSSKDKVAEEKKSPAIKVANKSAKKTDKNKTAVKTKSSIFTVITLTLGLSAAGLAAYNFRIIESQIPLNTQFAKTQIKLQSQIDQLGQQLQLTNSELVKEARARESAQAEHQALSSAMDSISAKLGRSTVAWRMAEVEYLLTVANHRLTLAQDRHTAIAIFETADERIKAIGDLSLLSVRKSIADELLALRSMPDVDITGLALQIASLINSVDKLPLQDKKRIAVALDNKTDNTPENWQELPMAIWNDLKSLVQVRRHQQPTEPLLPPDQTRHLYQNLSLKLEQARLAVLQRDSILLQQQIGEITSWLTHYFETASPAVVNAVASLKAMSTIELQPAIPDVSQSLRLLRKIMKGHRTDVVVSSKQAISK